MSDDPLLQPFQLGHLRLRNRIFSSSHAPAYNIDGTPSERYVAYHEEKAKGGIGLTMIGGSSNVSPDSPSLWGQLDYGSDAIIEPLGLMVERIRSHGAAVMTQLTHMGRRNVSNDGDWLVTIAPSPVREPMHRAWPKQMEQSDIRRVVADFAGAAGRAEAAGLDGIELCATSHLLDQFWTPLVNRRTDEYGGSLDNRLRFTFEVLDAVRQQIGDRLLLGIRMIGDEDQIGGLRADESSEIAQILAASGLLDFINITKSSLATEDGLSRAIPPSGTPLAPYLTLAASIKAVIDLPVLHATRITDVSSARHAISAGLIDLAGMTRAHFADPHIVAKLERGEADRIRVCVGASYCINRLHQGLDSVCIQNPATGRETSVPQLVRRTDGAARSVVVVGAGPGGLEAARVCAERGHRVVLFEAQDRVGGQMVLAIRASERQGELAGIVGWLEAEIGRAGVELRLNTPVDASEVLTEDPDVVITATGGSPDTSFLATGADLVHTTWDVLAGHVRLQIVTPDRLVGQDLAATTGPAYLRMLYENGVTQTPDHRLVGVERDGRRLTGTLRNEHTRAESKRTVDAIVVEHGVVPDDELYLALRDRSANRGEVDIEALAAGRAQAQPAEGFALYRVGDAVASRDIAAAIYEARRLCQAL